MAGAASPKQGRRRQRTGEGGTGGRMNGLTLGWSIGLAIVAFALLGGVIAWWIAGRETADQGPLQVMLPPPDRVIEEPTLPPRPGSPEILKAARNALAVQSPAEVEERVFTGGVDAAEVLAFLNATPERDGILRSLDHLTGQDANGLSIETVVVTFSGPQGGSRNRIVMMTPDEDGVWKMDYPAYVRLAEPSWDAFLKGSADRARVRVFVERDAYFNGPFADDRRWQCYAIASPDVDELMFGYCPVDSATCRAIEAVLARRKGATRVTLDISRPQGAAGRQFEIKAMVAEDWVVRGEPYETLFR
jgi:hypothetical protein